MAQIVRRSAAVLGFAACLAAMPGRAEASARRHPACSTETRSPACRDARMPYRSATRAGFERPGAAWLPPSRYVSLLILGIGY